VCSSDLLEFEEHLGCAPFEAGFGLSPDLIPVEQLVVGDDGKWRLAEPQEPAMDIPRDRAHACAIGEFIDEFAEAFHLALVLARDDHFRFARKLREFADRFTDIR